jgi:hypothetical protein
MDQGCKTYGSQVVCGGALHGGGKATKTAIYRLAKGERVLKKGDVSKMMRAGKKVAGMSKRKKKGCKCKHHK